MTRVRPGRLFLVDEANNSVIALSPTLPVRPYQTAVHIGQTPDVVLGITLLNDGRVAFTTGFCGGAYDIPYQVFVAEIPTL